MVTKHLAQTPQVAAREAKQVIRAATLME